MANAESTRASAKTCDCCGADGPLTQVDPTEHYCEMCAAKRLNWDEGARFSGLMALGQAVALVESYGAAHWEIYRAVQLALTSPCPDRGDDYIGIHPDDAHCLAAHIHKS